MEKNQNRVANVVLLLAALVLVLCVGMAIGGAAVYGALRLGDIFGGAGARSFDVEVEKLPVQPTVSVVTSGVVIIEVIPDSPAERAGLQTGDLILAVDQRQVGPEEDLADIIADYEPADRVTLEVQTPGEQARKVRVVLGENPEREGMPYLGVRYSSVPHFELPHRGPMPFGQPDDSF